MSCRLKKTNYPWGLRFKTLFSIKAMYSQDTVESTIKPGEQRLQFCYLTVETQTLTQGGPYNHLAKLRLLGDANDTASGTGAGVASLQRLLVSSLAEIVGAGVDDDGALEQS